MKSPQAYLAIPVELLEDRAHHDIRLRLSGLQARILIELSKRPCYLRMLERRLGRPCNVILRSLRSLMRRNIIDSIIYVSPEIQDKAGVRRYYVIKHSRHGRGRGSRARHTQSLNKIFVQDDKNIQKMRAYYKAMNMLQSPDPIKQSMARTILQRLDA